MNPDKAMDVAKRIRSIRGWFSFEAAMLFAWIDEIQKKNGIAGDIFEIGVHHGKSAIMLGAMVQPEREVLCVCDVFGDQSRNASRSGSGDRVIFERNLRAFFHDRLDVRILAKSSTDIGAHDIGTNYRFFHIDGGHNPDEALNDLQLAATATVRDGVIVVDDPLKPEWPGVSEAIVRFLLSTRDFCAIVVGFNKMVLTRRECADRYIRHIDNSDEHSMYHIVYPWHMKVSRFLDYPIRIFYMPTHLSENSTSATMIRLFQIGKRIRTRMACRQAIGSCLTRRIRTPFLERFNRS